MAPIYAQYEHISQESDDDDDVSITETLVRARKATADRFPAVAMPSLEYTDEVARETAHLYERVKNVVPAIEWPVMAPYVKAINDLKKARNAVILAHNYQTPEIFHCVADITGDSLQLAIAAAKSDADVIVQCGVHFMAETSKLLNPDKLVLIPDTRAGCSLAASITGADVRLLRERYPGVPVVTYVNTSADVKAESDICCTSSNAVAGGRVDSAATRVIFLPDRYLAKWVASQTKVKIIAWHGACEVHERFTGEELREYRAANPGIQILAHPECPPDVLAEADFTGSTAKMTNWVLEQPAAEGAPRHRMLDGVQHRGRSAGDRVHPAVQPLPAHEADHAAEDSRQPGLAEGRGDRRPDDRGESPPRGRAHDQSEELSADAQGGPSFRRKPDPSSFRRLDRRGDEQGGVPQIVLDGSIALLPSDDVIIVGGGLGRPVLRAASGAASGHGAHRRADRAGRVLGDGRRAASPPRLRPATRSTSTSPTRSRPATASSTRRSRG